MKLPDNKCARRKILKSEEVKIYERSQRNKDSMQENLDKLGFRSENQYTDCVSHLAW